ncbi:hypothetical protein BIWAKO_03206 [Bosea sp. BIWAKO-01]|nr:hypothetical protein BIWAKO_03206 [Bosea sp. BIWAKO-01]
MNAVRGLAPQSPRLLGEVAVAAWLIASRPTVRVPRLPAGS